MLKNISPIISPELLKVLAEMGHGDEIVIADSNFPACSVNNRVIRADGISGVDMLKAVISLIPLDTYSDPNAMLMQLCDSDKDLPTPIWDEYKQILVESEGDAVKMGNIERFAFYERAKSAYAVIATGETAIYANLIIKKGVIK